MASCLAARLRAVSPPSSYTTSSTRWPLRPPLSLMDATQTWAPFSCGRVEAPKTPEYQPTLATTAGDSVDFVAPEEGPPPEEGAGAPGPGAGVPTPFAGGALRSAPGA